MKKYELYKDVSRLTNLFLANIRLYLEFSTGNFFTALEGYADAHEEGLIKRKSTTLNHFKAAKTALESKPTKKTSIQLGMDRGT